MSSSIMEVVCTQKGSRFTFRNLSGEKSTYSWVVLLASGRYQKVYSQKYTAGNEFSYDFAELEPRIYKIRAFIRAEDGVKKSQDVAFIRQKEDGTSEVLTGVSNASDNASNSSESGTDRPCSHLEIVCLTTFSLTASSA